MTSIWSLDAACFMETERRHHKDDEGGAWTKDAIEVLSEFSL